ncbi:Putative protease YhbU [Candidatus Electronema halotolerans]
MELLSPAGSFPAFEAALEAGADAVYVGAPGFNARALSRDFTFAEIGSMIEQAHGLGSRVYVAMNSLVKEEELPAALEALSCFESLRPDALIVQDIGLLQLARAHFPSLPLHASTLLSVHNSLAAEELTRLGCSRVVLAREMTIEEIAAVHRQTKAELEVFVHGAMCFSYSGLCLFSSLHGGKSSLRGQCVQPCRRRYSWQAAAKKQAGPSGYFFSMNDLCGIDLLPELRQAGVTCLKIEGRLKSAHYVGSVTAAYRMAIDSLDQPDELRRDVLSRAHELLDEAMGRTRSSGYLLSPNPAEAVSPEQSGSSGLLLGKISRFAQEQAKNGRTRLLLTLTLTTAVRRGDRLRLHDETGGARISFTLRDLTVAGQQRQTAQAGEAAQIVLLTEAVAQFGQGFQGSLFRVDVEGRLAAERSGRRRSKELAQVKVLPNKKKVSQLLRQLAWQEETKIRRNPPAGRKKERLPELPCWVVLASPADLRERLPITPQRILLPLNRTNLRQLGGLRKVQAKIVWQLPPILHEAELVWAAEQIKRLTAAGWLRFSIGHCSQTALLPARKGLELCGQYMLNLLNSAALNAAAQLPGLSAAIFSVESEAATLTAALRHFRQRGGAKLRLGLYAYGRPPLFTSRLASSHFRWQQPFLSPKQERFFIEQQGSLTVARAAQPFSLLHQRQELAAIGLDFFVLDLSAGVRKEAAIVSSLLGRSSGQRTGRPPELLTGNFTGTLV